MSIADIQAANHLQRALDTAFAGLCKCPMRWLKDGTVIRLKNNWICPLHGAHTWDWRDVNHHEPVIGEANPVHSDFTHGRTNEVGSGPAGRGL